MVNIKLFKIIPIKLLNMKFIQGCSESKKQPVTKNNLQFSSTDIANFKATFEASDRNNDRKLNRSEFVTMVKNAGEKKTNNEIECLVSLLF